MSLDPYEEENIENVPNNPTFTGPENQYEELSVLGKGAYGKVYLVCNRQTNEKLALKRITVPVSKDGIPQSVLREISTMKTFVDMQHENVLKLHDVFHNISYYQRRQCLVVNMVVEKCEWDLYYFLRCLPRDMPENQIKLMIRQIFSGIDYLHSLNIVHRDIKPQNILVNRDLTIKIADFGLSRSFGTQSRFTPVVVTLWYRSPELLLQGSYNSACDIWSIGCILSELYARSPLFPGDTEAHQLSLIFQKLGTPPLEDWPQNAVINRSFYPNYSEQSFQQLNPKMSEESIAVIRRCFVYNPHNRCSAREALEEPYFYDCDNIVLHQ